MMTIQLHNIRYAECQPLVSVIIPAYNAEQFIAQTLESVIAQTYRNIEMIVVDDGSEDGTAGIVKHYMEQDSRIQLLQQPNAGVAAARNLGIEKSKGEFIAPLDADDIWRTENLEKQVNSFLKADDSVGIVYSWSFYIDENGFPVDDFCVAKVEGYFYTTLLCHNFIGNASATLLRRSCLKEIGGYSMKLKDQKAQGCEDFDLYLRIAEHYQIKVVPEFLVGYRKLSNGMSSNYKSMARSHEMVLQNSYRKYPEIPAILYHLSRSSLYLYFARQSYQHGDSKTALSWLGNSLMSAWLVTLIRPEFYQLGVKCLRNSFSRMQNVSPDFQTQTILAWPSEKDFSVQLKITFCNLLNKVVTRFRPPSILEY